MSLEATKEMVTNNCTFSLGVLSHTEACTVEFCPAQVACIALDSEERSIRSTANFYQFPPSPPLTNPHLKRAIPLPLLYDPTREAQCHVRSPPAMELMHIDTVFPENRCNEVHGVSAVPALLSPPYSPQKRSLSLFSVEESDDESSMHEALTDNVLTPIDGSNNNWQVLDGSEIAQLCSMQMDNKDDWNESLFLGAPSGLDTSDGLDLRLYDGLQSNDDEDMLELETLPNLLGLPSISPILLSDCDDEFSRPLSTPLDTKILEEIWDTIMSDPDESHTISPSQVDDTSRLEADDSSIDYYTFSQSPALDSALPESPSRRSVIDLPDDNDEIECDHAMPRVPLDFAESSHSLFQQDVDTFYDNQLRDVLRSRPSDTPNSTILRSFEDSPLNSSLFPILPSPSSHSLLFTSPESQEVPLPEPPEDETMTTFDHACAEEFEEAKSFLHEENRLRVLQRHVLAAEIQARDREAMLTEHIARLNAMKPPKRVNFEDGVECNPLIASLSIPNNAEATRTAMSMSVPVPSPSTASNMGSNYTGEPNVRSTTVSLRYSPPGPGPATLSFLKARQQEVQTAMSMRANERRIRKLTREFGREVDSLLDVKATQLRVAAFNRLKAQMGVGSLVPDSDTTSKDKVFQLAAKMIFRRQDSQRPLTSKSVAMRNSRPYIPSVLSRSAIRDDATTN